MSPCLKTAQLCLVAGTIGSLLAARVCSATDPELERRAAQWREELCYTASIGAATKGLKDEYPNYKPNEPFSGDGPYPSREVFYLPGRAKLILLAPTGTSRVALEPLAGAYEEALGLMSQSFHFSPPELEVTISTETLGQFNPQTGAIKAGESWTTDAWGRKIADEPTVVFFLHELMHRAFLDTHGTFGKAAKVKVNFIKYAYESAYRDAARKALETDKANIIARAKKLAQDKYSRNIQSDLEDLKRQAALLDAKIEELGHWDTKLRVDEHYGAYERLRDAITALEEVLSDTLPTLMFGNKTIIPDMLGKAIPHDREGTASFLTPRSYARNTTPESITPLQQADPHVSLASPRFLIGQYMDRLGCPSPSCQSKILGATWRAAGRESDYIVDHAADYLRMNAEARNKHWLQTVQEELQRVAAR